MFKSSCAAIATIAMLQPGVVLAQSPPMIEVAPKSGPIVQGFINNIAGQTYLSHDQKLDLLRKKVKYVFVLFQENRSFDHYFGTYPGARGLFTQPAGRDSRFCAADRQHRRQCGLDLAIPDPADGSVGSISPFLIPPTVKDVNGKTVQIYPADTNSIDHSHTGIDNSLDVDANNVAHNDRYALDEEGLTTLNGKIVLRSTGLPPTSPPSLALKQKGRAGRGAYRLRHDPVPVAVRRPLHAVRQLLSTVIGPSTPNAIAMIAGQSGETQWALHPSDGSNNTASPTVALSGGLPVVGDPGPFPGSNFDESPVQPPYGPKDVSPASPTLNQTYATLPLSFLGRSIESVVASDENPALDLLDVQHDIKKIASDKLPPVNWGWYQEGYDHEPTDGTGRPRTTATLPITMGRNILAILATTPRWLPTCTD